MGCLDRVNQALRLGLLRGYNAQWKSSNSALEESVRVLSNHLLSIRKSLEVDVNKQVGAGKCLFELTQGCTGYRFVVPSGRPRAAAWVGFRTRGIRTDKPMRPCDIICIRGDPLAEGDVVAGLQ